VVTVASGASGERRSIAFYQYMSKLCYHSVPC
jgi:hypothetical protein